MLGSLISVALFTGRLERREPLAAYGDRLAAREAYKRAAAVTWPTG